MDTTQSSPNPPSAVQSFSQSNRTGTSPPDLEGMGSLVASNGRSSLESTSDRPKTQAGEAPDNGKPAKGISKLLRKRKKKNNQNQTDEAATPDSGRDAGGSQSNESPDGNSAASSVNGNPSPPENESQLILTDDSEPDRYD